MISVIIPVKNGADTLDRCLKSISDQIVKTKLEILVIDSSSKDNSIDIAKKYGANIVQISSDQFNHGLTRNLGIRFSSGQLLFYTVQDAWLSDKYILQRMVDWFLNDDIMAVCGHQAVPHENDKNPFLWFKRFSKPVPEVRQWINDQTFPMFSWDNVIAMYRKTALLQLPFEKTDTTEDWIWSYEALLRGWKLVVDPSLVIWHYHHRTFMYVLRSEFSVMYIHYKRLGILPKSSYWFRKNMSVTYHLLRKNEIPFKNRLKWILHNYISNTSLLLTYYLFNFVRLVASQKGLDKFYNLICKEVPQGKQSHKL